MGWYQLSTSTLITRIRGRQPLLGSGYGIAPRGVGLPIMAPMNNPETAVVPPALTEPDADSDELVAEDLLVEEISIDGMCGVY